MLTDIAILIAVILAVRLTFLIVDFIAELLLDFFLMLITYPRPWQKQTQQEVGNDE